MAQVDTRLALLPAQGVAGFSDAVDNAFNTYYKSSANARQNALLDLQAQNQEANLSRQNALLDLQTQAAGRDAEKHNFQMDAAKGAQLYRAMESLEKVPPESRVAQIEFMKDGLRKYGFDDDDWDILATDEGLAQGKQFLSQYAPASSSGKLHKVGKGDKLVDGNGNVIADNPEGPDTSKSFDHEGKLRGEYTKFAKDYQQQNAAFGRIQAAANDPSPAGDLALIFNYMKLLDPGSTVREGEFATAQGAMAALGRAEEEGQFVPNIVKSYVDQLTKGTRLLPEQRRDFYSRSQALFSEAKQQHEVLSNRYSTLAQQYELDPSRVVIDLQTADPEKSINLGEQQNAYTEGQVIDIGGKKYRIVGGDPNDPEVELVE